MSTCRKCGNELILQNDFMKIGVDTSRGGAICHLSRASDGINLLNAYDCGRFIQQSYYGREDGSDWNGQPWKWNPVQGGSWQNQPAAVHKCCAEGGALVTVVNPRNWAGQQLLQDVTMSANVVVQSDHAHITFTLQHSGADTHPPRIQELPAVFVNRTMSQLVFYDGPEPWQGKALQVKNPGPKNENYRITENWAAYIDPTTGSGMGVYTPMAGSMTSYRVGPDGSAAPSDCSYFAPTMRFAITPGMTMTYHVFISLGRVEDMRRVFSGIRGWCASNRPEFIANPVPGATLAI